MPVPCITRCGCFSHQWLFQYSMATSATTRSTRCRQAPPPAASCTQSRPHAAPRCNAVRSASLTFSSVVTSLFPAHRQRCIQWCSSACELQRQCCISKLHATANAGATPFPCELLDQHPPPLPPPPPPAPAAHAPPAPPPSLSWRYSCDDDNTQMRHRPPATAARRMQRQQPLRERECASEAKAQVWVHVSRGWYVGC